MPLTLPALPFDRLLRAGDFSDVYLEDSQSLSIRWEDGKVQSVTDAADSGAGLRILSGPETRYAHLDAPAPFSLWGRDNVERFLSLEKQLSNGLSPRQSAPTSAFRFKSHDVRKRPENFTLDDKIKLLKRIHDAAKNDPLIKQVAINYGEKTKRIGYVNSDGVACAEERIYLVLSVQATAERGGDLQNAYEAIGGVGGFEIFDANAVEDLARLVAERAIKKLDAPAAPVGEMPVVISSSAGGTLIHEAVGHSLEADAVWEGTSPSYKGKIGAVVANEKITVLDDPTVPGARGSFHFDDEGVPSERSVLIENGVLKTFLFDRASAKRAGRDSNGHGRRESYAHRPIPRMSNTMIAPGPDDAREIVASLKNGFLVTKMGGGQVNTANGDFVFDVEEGFRVQNGHSTLVRGATLLGNGPDVLMNIDKVGSDHGWGLGTCGKEGQGVPVGDAIPTVRIKTLVIGGA